MSFKVNIPKVGAVTVPLTTQNFKKSDGLLFGWLAVVVIGGSLLLMFGK